jgi:hypothetical protein
LEAGKLGSSLQGMAPAAMKGFIVDFFLPLSREFAERIHFKPLCFSLRPSVISSAAGGEIGFDFVCVYLRLIKRLCGLVLLTGFFRNSVL